MMLTLYIRCFHAFDFRIASEGVSFRSAKGRALLVYLAVEQGTHQRSALAALLWPDVPDARARRNLTQTLLEVRKAIGDGEERSPYLIITHQSIAFNPDCSYQLDVADFEHALATRLYERAAELYRGDFLAGFELTDSDLFERWIQNKREYFAQRATDALGKLSAQQEANGQLNEALHTVRRIVELAPWQEEAHCQLMRLLARSGQRSAALAQYDTLTQLLMDELGVSPAPKTDALYDQILAGGVEPLAASNVVVLDAIPAPFQALSPPPHFVGRQAEIARLRTQLNAPGLQIHALVGMGGVGKTTIAAQIANALRDDFSDGVLWGNPATSSPLDILATWSSAFGYDYSQMSDIESRAAAVRGLLAEKKALLVVDNVDHLAGIQALLPTGENCAVLLTTRDLDIAHALNAEVTLLGELAAESALELLEEILGADRVAQETDSAIEICRVLSNLPLAVELTAQRLKSRPRMKLAQMAVRLGDQQQRLGLSISDRAVRASFEVSWDALDEALQAIFPLLAVFEGRSFTAEVVAYLADADLVDVEDALYALEALSLVRAEGTERWWQHPLLADFAREKLGNVDGVQGRFSDYFYIFSEEHAADFDRLDPEWENISAAMEAASSHGRWQTVQAYANVLHATWFTRARYNDARQGFALAFEASIKLLDDESKAMIGLGWGEACMEQNEYDEAQLHLNKSLDYYQQCAQAEQVADVQDHLARIAIEQNRYAEATRLLDENLRIRTEAGDQVGIASAQFQQARIYYAKADWTQAQEVADSALVIQTKLQDSLGTIRTSRLLAQIALQLEDFAQASIYCQQAQALSEEINDESELAITLYTLTGNLRLRKKYEAAKECANQSWALLQRMGDVRTEGLLLYQLSDIERSMGELETGIELGNKSVNIFRQLNDKIVLVYTLLQLGDLYMQQENLAESKRQWQEAHCLAQELEHPQLQAACSERLANIAENRSPKG